MATSSRSTNRWTSRLDDLVTRTTYSGCWPTHSLAPIQNSGREIPMTCVQNRLVNRVAIEERIPKLNYGQSNSLRSLSIPIMADNKKKMIGIHGQGALMASRLEKQQT